MSHTRIMVLADYQRVTRLLEGWVVRVLSLPLFVSNFDNLERPGQSVAH